MRHLTIAFLLFSTLFACQNNEPQLVPIKRPTAGFEDSLQNINKVLIQKDKERIEAYISRMNWTMQESGTGLRYAIIEKHNGEAIKDGSRIEIKYIVELLDGTVAYDSRNSGSKALIVGKTDSEAGLQEGLKMIGEGDSALFIAPPYLAKGLLGDFNKIPARSVLVYKVRVLDVENF